MYSIDNGQFFDTTAHFQVLPGIYFTIIHTAEGCERKDTLLIEAPHVPILILPTSVSLSSTELFAVPLSLNLPEHLIENIQWSPSQGLDCTDCLQPAVTPDEEDQIFQVAVTSTSGCSDTAQITLHRISPSSELFIPNIFAPEQDGANQLFHVFSAQPPLSFSMDIFDRWGNQMFHSTRIEDGWDGTFEGRKQSPGVYVCHIKWSVLNGAQQESPRYKAGDVLLIR